MDNYWIQGNTNYLKGCCSDPVNHPIKLPDCYILHALQTSDRARKDFMRLWPALLPCEKERFEDLKARFPGLFKAFADPTLVNDARMIANIQKLPIHTVGPNGAQRTPIICNKPMVQYLTG
jgi:hypothetical protein